MKNLAASPSASIPSGRRRITAARLGGLLSKVVLFVLLLGFAYVILYPFLAKFSASLMPKAVYMIRRMALIPRHPGLDNYKDILASGEFFPALWTTFYFALVLAVCATFCAAVVGYGAGAVPVPGQPSAVCAGGVHPADSQPDHFHSSVFLLQVF